MQGKIINLEDAKKLANYEKLYQQNIEYKSNNRILKEMLNNREKSYLKIIEEKNKRIAELEKEISTYKGKQIDIFEV